MPFQLTVDLPPDPVWMELLERSMDAVDWAMVRQDETGRNAAPRTGPERAKDWVFVAFPSTDVRARMHFAGVPKWTTADVRKLQLERGERGKPEGR